MTTADTSATGEGTDSSGSATADSTGEGTTTTATGESSGEASSSGGGGGGAWDTPCMQDDPPCPKEFPVCYQIPQGGGNVCTINCENPGDCPDAPSGDAIPTCGGMNMDTCVLDCSDGQTCPDGMECQDVFMGLSRCVWP